MEPSTNWTSTAGPAIWITFPTFSDIFSDVFSDINEVSTGRLEPPSIFRQLQRGRSHALQNKIKTRFQQTLTARPCNEKSTSSGTVSPLLRGRSTYDFDNFFGDLGLARSIHYQGQRVNHIARVVGGRIHGGHAGGVLGG